MIRYWITCWWDSTHVWSKYLTPSLIFAKTLQNFADNQKEWYYLALITNYFTPTSRICRRETPNDDHNFVGEYLHTFDDIEDIFSYVWIAVVMSGWVELNATRSTSWKHFCPDILDRAFLVILYQIYFFAFDLNCDWNSSSFRPINEQW